MVFIAIESYKNAGVNVIKDNNNYFWVKIKDVKNGLGIKNISDLLITKWKAFLKLKNLRKNKK